MLHSISLHANTSRVSNYKTELLYIINFVIGQNIPKKTLEHLTLLNKTYIFVFFLECKLLLFLNV